MKPITKEAYQLLHRGSNVLAQIEHNGVKIDTKQLKKSVKHVGKEIQRLERSLREHKIYGTWRKKHGRKAKLGSRDQLGDILFKEYGFPNQGKTESGQWRADDETLEKVDSPFVMDYLLCERYKKTKSTFLGGIQKEVVNGFLHPSFWLNTVTTYRSSSTQPNFQNLPIRNPLFGKIIRELFVARGEKRHIVESDFSGLEVRIAACYHKDPNMLKYLRDPSKDMHRDMAMDCYLLELSQVDKMTRYYAKNKFVFPEFYGSYFISCARDLWNATDEYNLCVNVNGVQVPMKEHLASKGIRELGKCEEGSQAVPGTFEYHIKEVERHFWNVRFPHYRDWKNKWYDKYLERGWFKHKTGFSESGLFARNDVINHPVQGSAFHCLLWSLIQLQDWLNRKGMKTLLIGQIHDSIIADVPEDELQEYLTMVKRITTVKLPKAWDWIIVPLDVEIDVAPQGGSWYDKTQWICSDTEKLWKPKPKK